MTDSVTSKKYLADFSKQLTLMELDTDLKSREIAKYFRRATGADDYGLSINRLVTIRAGSRYQLLYLNGDALLITDEGVKLVEDVPEMLGTLYEIAKQDEARSTVPVGHLKRAAETGDIAPVGLRHRQPPHVA